MLKSSLVLIQAMDIIFGTKYAQMHRNVGVRFQKKWLEHHHLEKSSDPLKGWVLKPGAEEVKAFSRKEQDAMELEIFKELGYVKG